MIQILHQSDDQISHPSSLSLAMMIFFTILETQTHALASVNSQAISWDCRDKLHTLEVSIYLTT